MVNSREGTYVEANGAHVQPFPPTNHHNLYLFYYRETPLTVIKCYIKHMYFGYLVIAKLIL